MHSDVQLVLVQCLSLQPSLHVWINAVLVSAAESACLVGTMLVTAAGSAELSLALGGWQPGRL
jgi:hypothetical protein